MSDADGEQPGQGAEGAPAPGWWRAEDGGWHPPDEPRPSGRLPEVIAEAERRDRKNVAIVVGLTAVLLVVVLVAGQGDDRGGSGGSSSAAAGALSLDDRLSFMRLNDLGWSKGDYSGYTEEDYDAETASWCSGAEYVPDWAEPPINESPSEYWLTVRVQCGSGRADEVLDPYSTDDERSSWEESFEAELDRLDLGLTAVRE